MTDVPLGSARPPRDMDDFMARLAEAQKRAMQVFVRSEYVSNLDVSEGLMNFFRNNGFHVHSVEVSTDLREAIVKVFPPGEFVQVTITKPSPEEQP